MLTINTVTYTTQSTQNLNLNIKEILKDHYVIMSTHHNTSKSLNIYLFNIS